MEKGVLGIPAITAPAITAPAITAMLAVKPSN